MPAGQRQQEGRQVTSSLNLHTQKPCFLLDNEWATYSVGDAVRQKWGMRHAHREGKKGERRGDSYKFRKDKNIHR